MRFRRRVQVVGEAIRDPVGDGLHRARRKVCVAGGRLELGVAEELGDHGQALAERERPGRERASQIRGAGIVHTSGITGYDSMEIFPPCGNRHSLSL